MSVITRGTVQTRKGQDWENRGKSFQSQGYLAATKEQKQKSLEGRKMADGWKNPDLILKTFSNSIISLKHLFFLFLQNNFPEIKRKKKQGKNHK